MRTASSSFPAPPAAAERSSGAADVILALSATLVALIALCFASRVNTLPGGAGFTQPTPAPEGS